MKKLLDFYSRNKSIYNLYHALIIRLLVLKTKFWYGHFLKKCGTNNLIIKPLLLTPEYIELNNSIQIRNNARIEGISKYRNEIFFPVIIFHDYVSIEQNLHLTCAEKIEIGKNTAIAANVTITDINHKYVDIETPVEQQNIEVKPVFIDESCKIYNNCVILPGTKIGKHCVLGANSVVSGIYPDYSIIVGAPAIIVKRFSIENNLWLKTDSKGNFIL